MVRAKTIALTAVAVPVLYISSIGMNALAREGARYVGLGGDTLECTAPVQEKQPDSEGLFVDTAISHLERQECRFRTNIGSLLKDLHYPLGAAASGNKSGEYEK